MQKLGLVAKMNEKKYMKLAEDIRNLVADLVEKGTHQDIAKITRFVAKKFGLNERLINYTHIEARNKLNEFKFRKIPYKDRVLFISHCLRNSTKCKAPIGDEGLECKRCGKCQINKILELAEELNYRKVFIVPGGSMVFKIMQKYKPRAVVGVACHAELNMGIDKASEYGIPSQAVMLLREGCKDTAVNLDEVVEKMRLFEGNGADKIEGKTPKKLN